VLRDCSCPGPILGTGILGIGQYYGPAMVVRAVRVVGRSGAEAGVVRIRPSGRPHDQSGEGGLPCPAALWESSLQTGAQLGPGLAQGAGLAYQTYNSISLGTIIVLYTTVATIPIEVSSSYQIHSWYIALRPMALDTIPIVSQLWIPYL
jgi:hypothetical protein